MAGSADIDLAIDVIPESARMSAPSLTMAWWSICSAMFFIFVAAVLAVQYGTVNAILGMLLAVPCFSFIAGIMARRALRTGQGCFLMVRTLFGEKGQLLATLVLFAAAVYYAVFEGSVLAVAATKVLPGLGYGAACALVVAYSVCLVFGSVQQWLNKFNGALLPLYLGGLLLIVALTVRRHGYSNEWLALGPSWGSTPTGLWHCFVAYFGLLGLTLSTADFARFGKKQDERYHTRVTFGSPFYLVTFVLNGLVGIFVVGSVQLPQVTETSVVDACLQILGGAAGLLFVWVSQTRINTANYYLSTINMQAFVLQCTGRLLPRSLSAILIGIAVLVLMLATNVLSYILAALALQGVVLVAWIGVALAHAFDRSAEDGQIESADDASDLRRRALAAWVVGIVVGLVLLWGVPAAASLSAPATFTLSFGLYAIRSRRTLRNRRSRIGETS